MSLAILKFIIHCESEGWTSDYILSQLKLYLDGVRDSRLHDNVCAFLPVDGGGRDTTESHAAILREFVRSASTGRAGVDALTDDEAERVINDYVRSDWSATRMGY
jgi:hypothetical protein